MRLISRGEDFPFFLLLTTGDVFPLIEDALLSAGETLPIEDSLFSEFLLLAGEGDVCDGEGSFVSEFLLLAGDGEVRAREGSFIREFLLLVGEGEVRGSEGSFTREFLLLTGEGVGECEGESAGGAGGGVGRGSTSRRPCVTRRTWQGSWRERKCSSVSQPPPTRTIMWRPFSN